MKSNPASARSSVPPPVAPRPGLPHRVDGWGWEHGAAGPVEIAGERVEDVDEPLAGGAEGLGRYADPSVANCGGRRGEVDGHGSNGGCIDSGVGRDSLWAELVHHVTHALDILREQRKVTGLHKILREERVEKPE